MPPVRIKVTVPQARTMPVTIATRLVHTGLLRLTSSATTSAMHSGPMDSR